MSIGRATGYELDCRLKCPATSTSVTYNGGSTLCHTQFQPDSSYGVLLAAVTVSTTATCTADSLALDMTAQRRDWALAILYYIASLYTNGSIILLVCSPAHVTVHSCLPMLKSLCVSSCSYHDRSDNSLTSSAP